MTLPFSKRSQVIKQLKTYGEGFFEDNVLIFSLSVTEGVNSKYVNGGTRSVIKKFSGGKLTVYVKTAYSESIPHNEESDDELHTRFNCYFTAVSKKSVKNAEDFKSIDRMMK